MSAGTLAPFAALSASYFAHIGFFNPYLPLWLKDMGFGLMAISVLTSVQSVTRLFAPYAWGWLSDRTGERVLAVPSVDGVNVLSGETAAWDQRGYVFSPYERYQITGWRKSSSEIAVFEFSSASSSYAGLTGRPANVGVIGVALFREQHALPLPLPQVTPQWPRRGGSPRDEESSEMREPAGSLREVPSASAAAPAPETRAASRAQKAESTERNDASDNLAKSAPGQSAQRTPKLGTAHGQREASVVTQTTFTRQQAQPNETISIRYDSRENLIAAGVIRQPIRPLAPRAFPQSDVLSYVPDPPRY